MSWHRKAPSHHLNQWWWLSLLMHISVCPPPPPPPPPPPQMHLHEWKVLYLIRISLKFTPKDSINNIPALVQIMAWRRSGDKPLSEPMLTQFTDAFMRHYGVTSCLPNNKYNMNSADPIDQIFWLCHLDFWCIAKIPFSAKQFGVNFPKTPAGLSMSCVAFQVQRVAFQVQRGAKLNILYWSSELVKLFVISLPKIIGYQFERYDSKTNCHICACFVTPLERKRTGLLHVNFPLIC